MRKYKNKDFTQVYAKGFDTLSELVTKNNSAARLYMFLAQNLDESTGCVAADQQVIAEHLGYSVRSVQRAIKYLEENGHLVRVPIGGNLTAYALDPHEVWKGYDNAKPYAVFRTHVITKRSDLVAKKLKVMMKK
ncbi:replication protein [Vibrio phage 1.233.A._10N.261.51.E6]|nr:replication protein [Vibrio phage 1.233.A._10N.261.51.E6]AUR96918.1 replication protein [Vibrio phage 1.233.B._10N.261.51.E6]